MSAILRGRCRVLQSLWNDLCCQSSLPQADRWFANQVRQHKKIGSQDRRWISRYFFAIFRFAPLNMVLAEAFAKTNQDAAACDANLLLELYPKYVARDDFLQELRKLDFSVLLAFTILRMDEESLLRDLGFSSKTADFWQGVRERVDGSLWHGIPFDKLQAVKERNFEQPWFMMQSTRPPTWLRIKRGVDINSVKADLASVKGLEIIVSHEHALAIVTERPITELKSYKNGGFEVQDLASQMIAETITVKPGEVVWDSCAGAGGKILAIADAAGGKGKFFASDIRAWKLDVLKERAKRAGTAGIKIFTWDATGTSHVKDCDWVLIDAPCSASGTWRRAPDAKFRFKENEIIELQDLQLRILSKVSEAVRLGGKIVYATCSYFRAENEEIIERFLESDAGKFFSLQESKLLGCPEFNADTMFIGLLQKTKAALSRERL